MVPGRLQGATRANGPTQTSPSSGQDSPERTRDALGGRPQKMAALRRLSKQPSTASGTRGSPTLLQQAAHPAHSPGTRSHVTLQTSESSHQGNEEVSEPLRRAPRPSARSGSTRATLWLQLLTTEEQWEPQEPSPSPDTRWEPALDSHM